MRIEKRAFSNLRHKRFGSLPILCIAGFKGRALHKLIQDIAIYQLFIAISIAIYSFLSEHFSLSKSFTSDIRTEHKVFLKEVWP